MIFNKIDNKFYVIVYLRKLANKAIKNRRLSEFAVDIFISIFYMMYVIGIVLLLIFAYQAVFLELSVVAFSTYVGFGIFTLSYLVAMNVVNALILYFAKIDLFLNAEDHREYYHDN